MHWHFVFYWHGQQRRRIDLEIGEGRGDGSSDADLIFLLYQLETDLLVLRALAGELNFQISLNGRGRGSGLRQLGAHGNHGKLRLARYLNHVQITVAVPGIEGLDRNRDQEVALSSMANAFAARLMTHAFSLMQGMRHMVGQCALLQDPLTVGCRSKRWECQKQTCREGPPLSEGVS
jgi:hypothetical protein